MCVETIEEIIKIAAKVFNCDVNDISQSCGPGDLPDWDSLGHITFIGALQQHYMVDLPVEELIEALSILDFAKVIDSYKLRQ